MTRRSETKHPQTTPETPDETPTSRRVNRSCLLCTQRKVKCDGDFPCRSCQRHKTPHLCGYRQRTRRRVVSRESHRQLENRLQAYTDVLTRAFPGVDIDQLAEKDGDELAGLLGLVAAHVASHTTDSSLEGPPEGDTQGHGDEDDGGTDRRWDESSRPPTVTATDDNNAVGVATDERRPSFLGITSNGAVLRAIFRLDPSVKQHVSARAKTWTTPVDVHSPAYAMDPSTEQRLVNFYFDTIHPITPILCEDGFRATHAAGHRRDASWLGLQYMILALGSIASGSSSLHGHYHDRAQEFLNFETLGNGNLESLQALILLGGYSLHFRNSPNMAFAVLGAAHRMAIALGLHREEHSPGHTRVELRRRIWWGLFTVDTWMSMSLGRPTCGRWDACVMDTHYPGPVGQNDHTGVTAKALCGLASICNRAQHRYAQLNSPISISEATDLNAELTAWYASLPAILLPTPDSPERLSTARQVLRYRYFNVRLLLYRSTVLSIASSRPPHVLTPDETRVMETLRALTTDCIENISLHWLPNPLHVWASAWHLFQACLVPLLCIAMHRTARCSLSEEALSVWVGCVTKALALFAEMRPWMRSSDRTPDIVEALLEAVDGGASIGLVEAQEPWFDIQWPFGGDLDWEFLQPSTDMLGGVFSQ